MQTPERVIGGTLAVLLALTAPAAAQGSAAWQVSRGDNFVAASICQSGSDRQCVRLQCLTMEGGGVSFGILHAALPNASSATARAIGRDRLGHRRRSR